MVYGNDDKYTNNEIVLDDNDGKGSSTFHYQKEIDLNESVRIPIIIPAGTASTIITTILTLLTLAKNY